MKSSQREDFIMQAFVARQPIFDAKLEVQAYELLFRSGAENFFFHADGTRRPARSSPTPS